MTKLNGHMGHKITSEWIARVKSLERGASATLEAFLFDSDDPRVHKGRQMLALPGEATSQRGVTDWGRCESRHRRARKDEGLGNRRPFTDWEGGCTLPDYAWNDWGKAQTDRVLDLMDIDYLRLAQSGTDSMHKTLVWNLSQNVDRTTGSGAAGICPCLTPSMVPFVTNRGGPLVGIEALSLQGIPVDDLLLTRESEGQMSDLAGNAMTTTVVGACMLSALLLMKDELVEHTKKVNAKLKAEAKTKESEARKAGGGSKTLAKSAAALSVGGAAGSVAAASTVEGADDLKEEDLVLCCATDRKEHTSDILDRAHRSARLCVCEAQTGSRDAIYRCEDCGHTACADCKGRPEHNYKRHDIERIAPDVFSAHLKQTLPMRVKLSGLNVAAEVTKAKKLAEKLDVSKLVGVADGVPRRLTDLAARPVGETYQVGKERKSIWTAIDKANAEKNVANFEKKMVDDAKATWVAFAEALETIAGADFMFREVKRADVWTARYVCPSTDEVVLELRLGRTVAQSDWRVVVKPAPAMREITNEETGEKELKEFAPHPVYQWPLARMRLAPGASHLLDGVWDVLAPIEHAFDVAIEGKGEKKKNWQTELGMIGNDDPERLDISLPDGVDSNRAPWSDLRWSEYVVTTLKTDGMTAKEFEQQKESFPVDGTYALHDKCGTAMASLHKRVDPKPTLNKSAEAYFFLDPVRNSDGKEDFFVFADNHRRLQYGEHRMHAARVHHSFRPSDAKGKETFACRTDGRWMKSDEVNLIQLDDKRAAKQGVPKNAKALSSRAGGCQAAVAIMKAKVPLAEVDASAWPEDEFETLQNDRSSEVFQRLAWFTSRLALPSEVRSFTTLDEKRLNSNACGGAKCPEACPRCAPSPPVLQWTCKAGESKITAREDPRQAAAYEQALKRRPAPFVVQWRKTAAAAGKKLGELVIAVNPATLAHRALANVYSGVAKERSAAPQAEDKPTVEWQVVKHEEREAAVALADFTLKSNRGDAKAPQPKGWNTKFPLRPEQLRSLGWMIRQEQTTEPFVEEEVAESVHPALGLRMDGRARVERLVRGGIIADQVGYGKTAITIGAILASEIKFPLPNAMAKPVNAIPTKATLVLAPSQLLKQWPREVEKFSAEGRLVTLVIRTVADISHYTVQDFQRADVVICATSVLRSPLYFERLARLAGVASLPQCKAAGAGRHFAASYRDCLDKLETQCERLTSGPNGVVECAANVRKGKGETSVITINPKRLKGAALVKKTKELGGMEGFKYAELAARKKATDLAKSIRLTTPPRARATSPRARLARASASKPIKYADDGDDFGSDFESDSDSSEYDEVDEEEEERKAKAKAAAKRRAAACAKGKKSKSPASASASPDEADESADKDHWGFETTSVERDWTKTSSCPLELFHWRRVVVDEFTYLQQSDRCVVLGLKAEARWCLSGTPPVGAFSEIKDTAALLGTNLGSDEMPRYTKAEITKAESFQFFKEKPTQHWHATRHAVAQGFLDRFVRQNIAEIDEIKSVTDLNLLNLRPVEKAIYLELEHYLKSTDMMVKTKKKKSSDGDRDKRMAKVLEGSASGAEALVKCVTKFKLDNDAGAGTGACNAIVRVREEEKEDCERNIVRAVLDAKVMFWEAKEMARELGVDVVETEIKANRADARERLVGDLNKKYDEFDFVKFMKNVVVHNLAGDPEVTELITTRLLKHASDAVAATHECTVSCYPLSSILRVNLGKEGKDGNVVKDNWKIGMIMEVTGSQKQKCAMAWKDRSKADVEEDKYEEIEYKKLRAKEGRVEVIYRAPLCTKEKDFSPPSGPNDPVWKLTSSGSEDQAKRKIVPVDVRPTWIAPTKIAKGGGGAADAPATPAATPKSTPKKIDTPSSRAPSKTAAKSYEDMTKNQQKAYRKPVDDKMWQLRDHTHDVNALVNELSGRTRALRFFKAVRELQSLRDDDAVVCQACEAKSAKKKQSGGGGGTGALKRTSSSSVCMKRDAGLISECGHVGCLACLRADANLQECGVPGCARACGGDNIITAASLGTEREGCVDGDAALASPTKKKRGGGGGGNGGDRTAGGGSIVVGRHGKKMSELVQSLRGFNPDERVLIFIQYPDLMKQVSDVLDDANIKYLKLKGSVHQQCAALDEFQKEKLRPGDARVLMLLSRDESASGANLTTANHAIFVHPLETNTQYEYDASETQAIGRIRRYGQTKLVHVHRLIAKDTIEEKIYNERGGEMFKGTHVK
jgi:hypothetical protein